MAWLYCKEHGAAEHERGRQRHDSDRAGGDTVQYTSGRLKSGPWRCDTCNKELQIGDEVVLTRILYFGPDDNDYEKEYMKVQKSYIDVFVVHDDGPEA